MSFSTQILLQISVFSLELTFFTSRNLSHDLVFLSEMTSHTHTKNPKTLKETHGYTKQMKV